MVRMGIDNAVTGRVAAGESSTAASRDTSGVKMKSVVKASLLDSASSPMSPSLLANAAVNNKTTRDGTHLSFVKTSDELVFKEKIKYKTMLLITPFDGKYQNLQMYSTHFALALTVSET